MKISKTGESNKSNSKPNTKMNWNNMNPKKFSKRNSMKNKEF